MLAAIRSVDPDTLVWYEPHVLFNNGADTNLPDFGDPNIGMSFHDYCLASNEGGGGYSDACKASDGLVMDNALKRSAATGDALLLTEFGATDDRDSLLGPLRPRRQPDDELAGVALLRLRRPDHDRLRRHAGDRARPRQASRRREPEDLDARRASRGRIRRRSPARRRTGRSTLEQEVHARVLDRAGRRPVEVLRAGDGDGDRGAGAPVPERLRGGRAGRRDPLGAGRVGAAGRGVHGDGPDGGDRGGGRRRVPELVRRAAAGGGGPEAAARVGAAACRAAREARGGAGARAGREGRCARRARARGAEARRHRPPRRGPGARALHAGGQAQGRGAGAWVQARPGVICGWSGSGGDDATSRRSSTPPTGRSRRSR